VQVLSREVLKWSPPGTEFACLSDVDIPGVKTIPLKTTWPTWWAKMELCDPEITGDILFMDIDTVIVGPIDDFLTGPFTTFRGCGALHLWPEADRKIVWDIFTQNPERIIEEYWGEDVFLRSLWTNQFALPKTFADTLEDKLSCGRQWLMDPPGQLLYRGKKSAFMPPSPIILGPDTRIIMFQSTPRPWRTPEFRHLYR
jgi:hypothetical protein